MAASCEPKRTIQGVLSYNNASKSNTDHEYDSCLLSIDGHKTAAICDFNQTIEGLSEERVPPDEMAIDVIAATGVPDIAAYELVTAAWASPKRCIMDRHKAMLSRVCLTVSVTLW
jgi:hypothetical protein